MGDRARGGVWGDVALFLAPLLIYVSVFTTRFGFLDDYAILAATLQNTGEFVGMNYSMGRPVAAVVMDQSFRAMHTVDDLRFLRLGSVLGFGLAAILLRRLAVRAGHGPLAAACIALLLITLPGVQVYICWATLWFYPFLICLVVSALFLLDFPPARRPAHRGAAAVLAVAMLIIVGLSHQPMVFLFIPLFMLRYWATPAGPRVSLRDAALHAVVFGAALVICFAVFKLGDHPAPRGSFPQDLPGKAAWFVTRPLVNALNLVNINLYNYGVTVAVAVVVALVIFAGSVVAFWPGRPGLAALGRIAVLPVAIVLAYTPNLMVIENWPTFRSGYALGSMVLVAFLWGLHNLCRAAGAKLRGGWPVALGAFTLTACVLASLQSRDLFARPQQSEFNLLKSQLAGLPLKAGDRLTLITPEGADSTTWIQLYDEFGVPSASASWVWRPMFWLALRDTHPPLVDAITLTPTRWYAPVEGDFTIDLHTALPQAPP